MKKPFFIRYKGALRRLNTADILFIEADGNYVTLFLINDKPLQLIRSTMKAAIKSFPDQEFVQVSRSTAVSLHYLESIFRNSVVVCMPEGHKLELKTNDLQSGAVLAERIEFNLERPYRKELENKIAILGQEEKRSNLANETSDKS